MAKPTLKHRAKEKLESLGWKVGDVERIMRRGPVTTRFDLFGILDLIAINGRRTLGLQVTDHSSVAKHVEKMLQAPRLWDCLGAGWLVECWGVRSKRVRDGSFAKVRRFELDRALDTVTTYDDSSILLKGEL